MPEPRTVKQRVHLDVRAESMEPFAGFERISKEGEHAWTTLADPEGGEFCVFTYDEPPAQKFKSIVVDSADHVAISDWWAGVIGGKVSHDDGYSPLEEVPGLSTEGFDFVPVPEPKTVKNRIHWDVESAARRDARRPGGRRRHGPDARRGEVLDRHGRSRGQRVLRLPERVTPAVRRRVVE